MSFHDSLLFFINKYGDSLNNFKQTKCFNAETQARMVEARDFLKSHLKFIDENYKVKVSQGAPQWPSCPWIGIRDSRVTSTFQKGVYIVYLLNKDTKKLYLTLNQGATAFSQYENIENIVFSGISSFENEETISSLLGNAANIRTILKAKTNTSLDYSEIDCGSSGYNAGTIFSLEYSIDRLPNDDALLLSDLDNFIALYQDYFRIFFEEADIVEDEQLVNDIRNDPLDYSCPFSYTGTKKEKAEQYIANSRIIYKRDRNVSKNALQLANFCCEINPAHKTFIRKNSDKNYTEPHHLVPMSYSDRFRYSLDVEENVVSLCSNCHNEIHYGRDSKKLIDELYKQRRDLLKSVGIDISLKELLNCYS